MRFCTVFSCVFIHFCRAFLYVAKMRFHHQLMRFHKTAIKIWVTLGDCTAETVSRTKKSIRGWHTVGPL